jgi:hypothetical protein
MKHSNSNIQCLKIFNETRNSVYLFAYKSIYSSSCHGFFELSNQTELLQKFAGLFDQFFLILKKFNKNCLNAQLFFFGITEPNDRIICSHRCSIYNL